MREIFRRLAGKTSNALGSPWAFLVAVILVGVWVLSGPYFEYSNGWQLVVNTVTSIGTFLMIFILQNSQNRDTKAVNLKIDELLRAIEGARTGLVNLNELSDEDLEQLEGQFRDLGQRAASAEKSPAPPRSPPQTLATTQSG